MKKLIIGFLCLVLGVRCAFALIVSIDGIKYDIYDTPTNLAFISKCESSPTEINIPSVEHEGVTYPVVRIFNDAFSRCTSLTSVSLPNVETVEGSAFSGCTSLTSVSLPNVVTVGAIVFSECTSLTSISLPKAETVGRLAFSQCRNLTSVSLPAVTEIANDAFEYVPVANIELGVTEVASTLFDDHKASLSFVSLPNATSIWESAFNGYSELKSISLPNVTSIGDSAFRDCSNLDSISVPKVTSIGESAFNGCKKLTSLSLPNVTSVGPSAFSNCWALRELFVNDKTMRTELSENKNYYGLNPLVMIYQLFTKEQTESGKYVVKSICLKIDGEEVSWDDYKRACDMHGVTMKQAPENPQLVQEGQVAVSKTEIQAAKAETVTVEGGVVTLGVTVNTNGNFQAETKDWKPVELKPENVSVVNGKVVISLPADSQQGFMILQSGDAKVGE